jgi:hypothetical protein
MPGSVTSVFSEAEDFEAARKAASASSSSAAARFARG